MALVRYPRLQFRAPQRPQQQRRIVVCPRASSVSHTLAHGRPHPPPPPRPPLPSDAHLWLPHTQLLGPTPPAPAVQLLPLLSRLFILQSAVRIPHPPLASSPARSSTDPTTHTIRPQTHKPNAQRMLRASLPIVLCPSIPRQCLVSSRLSPLRLPGCNTFWFLYLAFFLLHIIPWLRLLGGEARPAMLRFFAAAHNTMHTQS